MSALLCSIKPEHLQRVHTVIVHQRIDSLLKLIGVRVSGLLHVEDLANVPHILYNVIQRLINGSTSQFSIDGNAKLLIGLDSANAAFGEHQRTLAIQHLHQE